MGYPISKMFGIPHLITQIPSHPICFFVPSHFKNLFIPSLPSHFKTLHPIPHTKKRDSYTHPIPFQNNLIPSHLKCFRSIVSHLKIFSSHIPKNTYIIGRDSYTHPIPFQKISHPIPFQNNPISNGVG